LQPVKTEVDELKFFVCGGVMLYITKSEAKNSLLYPIDNLLANFNQGWYNILYTHNPITFIVKFKYSI